MLKSNDCINFIFPFLKEEQNKVNPSKINDNEKKESQPSNNNQQANKVNKIIFFQKL
jgi:hypothetical protein